MLIKIVDLKNIKVQSIDDWNEETQIPDNWSSLSREEMKNKYGFWVINLPDKVEDINAC